MNGAFISLFDPPDLDCMVFPCLSLDGSGNLIGTGASRGSFLVDILKNSIYTSFDREFNADFEILAFKAFYRLGEFIWNYYFKFLNRNFNSKIQFHNSENYFIGFRRFF